MIKIKSIINNKIFKIGSLSFLATVLTRAINLIAVPIFSRILTTSEYGRIEVFLAYVNIFMIVLGLDIHGTVGKGRLDFPDENDELLCSGILMTTISAVSISLLINIFFVFLQGLFGLERWLVNIMLLYSYGMFLMSFRSADYNFSYNYKKNMRMTASVAVLNLLLSILFIEFIFKRSHVLGRVLGATIPTAICGGVVFIGYVYRGNYVFKNKYNKYFLEFGIPLIPHNLSHLVLSSSDRVMINSMISSSMSGIYSLAYTLGMMVQVASEALNQVFVPWLFKRMQKQEENIIRKAQRLYLLIYCVVVIGVLTISPELLKIIGARQYWDGAKIILWIVFATFLNFTYTLYVNIEFFYRKTALISSGTIMAALINFCLNYLFLNRYGYYFAAASTVISYMALLVFHAIIVNFILKIKFVDGLFVFGVVAVVFGITVIMQLLLNAIVLRFMIGLASEAVFGFLLFMLYKKTGKVLLITEV